MPWDYNIHVIEYIHKISPLFIDPAPGYPTLMNSEVCFNSNFIRRCTCTLMNGTTKKRLSENKGSWIIIDNYYFTSPLYEITAPNRSKRIIQFHDIEDEIKNIIDNNPKYEGYTLRRIDASPNYSALIPKLANYLNENYAGNIIIIDSESASKRIEHNRIVNAEIDTYAAFCRKYGTSLLIDRLKCHYISLPSDLITRDDVSVHYNFEVFFHRNFY